jgi:hypothetical protein
LIGEKMAVGFGQVSGVQTSSRITILVGEASGADGKFVPVPGKRFATDSEANIGVMLAGAAGCIEVLQQQHPEKRYAPMIHPPALAGKYAEKYGAIPYNNCVG